MILQQKFEIFKTEAIPNFYKFFQSIEKEGKILNQF